MLVKKTVATARSVAAAIKTRLLMEIPIIGSHSSSIFSCPALPINFAAAVSNKITAEE